MDDFQRRLFHEISFYVPTQTMKVTITNSDQTSDQKNFADIVSQSDKTLLYFYPKDDTPGCTLEATDFSGHADAFAKAGIQVIGVSRDGHESHCAFMQKHKLTIPLIVDEDLTLHKKFGAYGEKNNYGKMVE
ncbi:peroxiredoxin [bacterium]|nr:peroxiredoxin [bacterium]